VIPLMKRRTFLLKWALPYALVTLVLAWHFREQISGSKPDYPTAAFVSAALFIILFFVIKRQSKQEPDEVLDGGSFLRVSYGNATEDIPVGNLQAVETNKLLRLTRVALVLRTPSSFGEVISFYPLQEKDASGENAVAASLRRRVHGSQTSATARS
jgi:hypothetical protein